MGVPKPKWLKAQWSQEGASNAAEKIIASCKSVFQAKQDDCNGFLAAVANLYFQCTGFDYDDADGVLRHVMNPDNGWTDQQKDPQNAILAAKSGNFVIAGMRSTDFTPARNHGHLAIVVGLDGQRSGKVIVPLCYAGSLRGPAAYGKRISMTFRASDAQNGNIFYFSKFPDIEPVESAFEIALDVLRKTRLPYFRNPMVHRTPAKGMRDLPSAVPQLTRDA